MMDPLDALEHEAQSETATLPGLCALIAKQFGVRTHEVAVLVLRHSMLQFVYPPELRTAGMIPLISSAQAAKTANSRRAELFNNFVLVKHSSIFETIKIADGNPMTIQKLMSAPIQNARGEVIGVLQVCRKAESLENAGADFTETDLAMLKKVSSIVAFALPRLAR